MMREGSPDHRQYSNVKLYVGEIGNNRKNDLFRVFEKFGSLRTIYVDEKKRYGFIEYVSPQDAMEALRRMDGRNVNGTRLRVEFAHRDSRSPHHSGGGRHRSFRDRHFSPAHRRGSRRRSPRRSRNRFSPNSSRRWSPARRSPGGIRGMIQRSPSPPSRQQIFRQRSASNGSPRRDRRRQSRHSSMSQSPVPHQQQPVENMMPQFQPTTMIPAPNGPPGTFIPLFQYPAGAFDPYGAMQMPPFMNPMLQHSQAGGLVQMDHQQAMQAPSVQLAGNGDEEKGRKKRRRRASSKSPQRANTPNRAGSTNPADAHNNQPSSRDGVQSTGSKSGSSCAGSGDDRAQPSHPVTPAVIQPGQPFPMHPMFQAMYPGYVPVGPGGYPMNSQGPQMIMLQPAQMQQMVMAAMPHQRVPDAGGSVERRAGMKRHRSHRGRRNGGKDADEESYRRRQLRRRHRRHRSSRGERRGDTRRRRPETHRCNDNRRSNSSFSRSASHSFDEGAKMERPMGRRDESDDRQREGKYDDGNAEGAGEPHGYCGANSSDNERAMDPGMCGEEGLERSPVERSQQ